MNGKGLRNCGAARLHDFETKAVGQAKPIGALRQLGDAPGRRLLESRVQVLGHHADMAEAALRSFEIRIGYQLKTADRPNLRGGLIRPLNFAQGHPQHFAEEADMPVDVFDANSDVLDIGSLGIGRDLPRRGRS